MSKEKKIMTVALILLALAIICFSIWKSGKFNFKKEGNTENNENENRSDFFDNNESVDKKEKGRIYPITDEKNYRIISGRKYVCEKDFWADSRYQETLEVKIGREWIGIYRTEDKGDNNCFSSYVIGKDGIKISPLRDYVEFSIIGWEWSQHNLINIKTRKQVLEKDIYTKEVIWSMNAKNYAFISFLEDFGGTGKDAIWTSEFNNPDKSVLIFDLREKLGSKDHEFILKHRIDGLRFINNRVIEFSILFQDDSSKENTEYEIVRFRYNLDSKNLDEVFRKK